MAKSRPESVADADRIDQADAWFEEVRQVSGHASSSGRRDAYYLGGHHIAFAMVNLRHVIAEQ